jgi:hypothetical protein
MIPSDRVFRRDGANGPFVVLHYGTARLRVLPALWQELPPPAFEMGDWVEVLSSGLKHAARTGTIREIRWDEDAQEIRYQILEAGRPIEERYAAEDLKRVEPTGPMGGA